MMEILRSDLFFSEKADQEDFFVLNDPVTNEKYRFGEQEFFIIQEIQKPYNKHVLLNKFKARFKEPIDASFIDELIEKLNDWRLLEEEEQTGASTKPGKADSSVSDTGRKRYNHWSLFNPQKVLDNLLVVLGPFRHFTKIIPLFCALALFAFLANQNDFRHDLAKVSLRFNFIEHLVYTLFSLNLITITIKGCIARFYHLPTPSFGMMLAYGVIPRFDVPIDIPPDFEKSRKLRLYSASILVRVCIISLGILTWLISRQHGSTIAIWSSALVLYSIMTLLFIANPLLGADGYRYLSTYFDSPNLRQKANRSLKHFFFKPPEVIARYTEDKLALRIYAISSILFLVFLVLFVGYTLAHWLESNYQGFGIAVFILLVIYIFGRLKMMSNRKKMTKKAHLVRAGNQADTLANRLNPNSTGQIPAHISNPASTKPGKKPKRRAFFSMSVGTPFKYLFWLALILVLFVPYRYEPGGDVTILPISYRQIFTETSGIMKHINYDGGEWLAQGTLVAEIENDKQYNDVQLTRSEIEKKKEDINVLLTTPSDQEVEQAKQQVQGAKVKHKYSEENFSRVNELYKQNSVSLITYLDAKEQLDLDYQEVLAKEANLQVILEQINAHKVASLKIELDILDQNLTYFLNQLEKTKLRMPSDGVLVTMNLKNNLNTYYDLGQFFAEVENTSEVLVEILIPESDAKLVRVGDTATFRPLSDPTTAHKGSVSVIHPKTETTDYGQAIKVVCILPNNEKLLKTGMTGHAKLEGRETTVGVAYTKSLLSFILIELWSWLP